MGPGPEAAILRRRADELAAADTRHARAVACAPAMVVVTVKLDTYPTGANSYFACHPVAVSGKEAEGEAVTLTADSTQVLFVENLGTKAPPEGTNILATMSGGRWSMRYDG